MSVTAVWGARIVVGGRLGALGRYEGQASMLQSPASDTVGVGGLLPMGEC